MTSFQKKFCTISLGLILSASSLAQKSDLELDKTSDPLSTTNSGKSRVLHPGESLQIGDEIENKKTQGVVLVAPDGSRLTLGQDTQVKILSSPHAEHSLMLNRGNLHGDIIPIKSSKKPSHLRYLVRTRSATMGVRGTEFMIKQDPLKKEAEFYTLRGQTEVADSVESILAGRGQRLDAGNVLRSAVQKLGPVQKFNPEKLRQEFKNQMPTAFKTEKLTPPGAGGKILDLPDPVLKNGMRENPRQKFEGPAHRSGEKRPERPNLQAKPQPFENQPRSDKQVQPPSSPQLPNPNQLPNRPKLPKLPNLPNP